MRSALVATLAAVVLSACPLPAAGSSDTREDWPWSHTRCMSETCRSLLLEGASQSGYLRALLEELDRSDVFVHIVVLNGTREGRASKAAAWLSFTAVAADKYRYLRATLDSWQAGYWDSIPLIAHELQHAVEVARAPEVRDTDSFERFYRRVGWGSGAGAFETEEARETTRAVRAELAWARGARPAAARH